MSFDDVKGNLKKLNCDVKSDAVEFFFEAVFTVDVLESLDKTLQDYFGPPLKPAQQEPTAESDAYSGRYGGAKVGQTLYVLKKDPQHSDVALIWPWSSGQQFTVKLIRG